MKKILILLIMVLIFLTGCQTKQTQTSQQNEQISCSAVTQPQAEQGCTFTPVYNEAGTCIINYKKTCQNTQNQQTTSSVKEFTVEGDDYSLYPDALSVNRGDNVKLTLKVRTNNVYHGGLEFRSDIFGDTGQIMPGATKTVEFTADKTFEFKSYWPSTSVLKATGTITVA